MNNPYTAKKRLNSDGSYYIFRFWPVATLLVFITYFLVAGLQERADVPRYHRDCAAAWSSSNSPFPTQPCFYKPATVDLTTRHDHGPRGSGDSQSAEITYPDGSTSLMSVQKIDGRENSAQQTGCA